MYIIYLFRLLCRDNVFDGVNCFSLFVLFFFLSSLLGKGMFCMVGSFGIGSLGDLRLFKLLLVVYVVFLFVFREISLIVLVVLLLVGLFFVLFFIGVVFFGVVLLVRFG